METRLWGDRPAAAYCLPSRGAHLELEVIMAGGTFHGERLGEAKEEAEGVQDPENLCSGSRSLRPVGPKEPPNLGLAPGPFGNPPPPAPGSCCEPTSHS